MSGTAGGFAKEFEAAYTYTFTPSLHPHGYHGRFAETPDDIEQAARDYKTLGTRAPLFKNWFGDWEDVNADSSKVVNPDNTPQEQNHIVQHSVVLDEKSGEPIPLYHGTDVTFDAFDKSKQNPNDLYGPGFYFTESAEIAGGKWEDTPQGPRLKEIGYAQAGLATLKLGPDEAKKVANLITKEMNVAPSNVDFVKKLLSDFTDDRYSEGGNVKWLQTYLASLGINVIDAIARSGIDINVKGNLYKVFLNIRNPFRIDGQYSKEEIKKIFGNEVESRTVNVYGGEAQDGKFTGDIIYKVLTENMLASRLSPTATRATSQREAVADFLKAKGFDGITHIGGGNAIVGNMFSTRPHRVWIAFEPTQIKSVDNRGTFDPDDPHYKLAYAETLHPRYKGKWIDKPLSELDSAGEKLKAVIKAGLVPAYDDDIDNQIAKINKEQYAGWAQKLTNDEQQALKDYAGSSFSWDLNENLRSETVEMSDRNVRVARDLTSALSKASFPQDIILYRGITDPYGKLGNKFKDNIGKTFTDKGFVSTTLNYKYIGNQISSVGKVAKGIVIKIPKGAKAAGVDPYNSTMKEWEVLIQRNSRFRVLKYDGKIAYLELVT
jgi:hypothetical protein